MIVGKCDYFIALKMLGGMKFFFCILITSVVGQDIITPPPDQKIFRKDYKYEPATEMFYKVHKIPLSFQDAVNLCKFEGASLAVPRTESEATMFSNLFHPGVRSIWVGIHDIFAEGNFMTLDGTSIDDVYSKWRNGEPNSVDEDCVEMFKEKDYNDANCNAKLAFICTIPEESVNYNLLCETNDKEYFYNIDGDRCYKVHTQPRTWHDAFKICKAEEAGLVLINSDTEAKFLANIFNTRYPSASLKGNFFKDAMHVDFTDILSPGEFQTSDGKSLSSVGYDVWDNGQPDNNNGNEHCGSMLRSGKLNDLNCDIKTMFFCEKVLGVPQSVALLARSGYKNHIKNQ